MTWPIEAVRAKFPALSRQVNGQPVVYLDGPGGSQMPQVVIEALANYWRQGSANTHGAFITSQLTDRLIGEARAAAADFLHAAPGATISFGANMTSLSFALADAMASTLGRAVWVKMSWTNGNARPPKFDPPPQLAMTTSG